MWLKSLVCMSDSVFLQHNAKSLGPILGVSQTRERPC